MNFLRLLKHDAKLNYVCIGTGRIDGQERLSSRPSEEEITVRREGKERC